MISFDLDFFKNMITFLPRLIKQTSYTLYSRNFKFKKSILFWQFVTVRQFKLYILLPWYFQNGWFLENYWNNPNVDVINFFFISDLAC